MRGCRSGERRGRRDQRREKVHANANRNQAMDYEELARAIVEEAVPPPMPRSRRPGRSPRRRAARDPHHAPGREEGSLRDARRLGWMSTAPVPSRQHRVRAHGRSSCARASGALRKSSPSSVDANAQYEAYPARSRMKDEQALQPSARPAPAAEGQPTSKVDATDPDSELVHEMSRAPIQGYNAQAACDERAPDRRGRGHERLAGLRAPRPDGRRDAGASSPERASPPSPTWSSPNAGYWRLERVKPSHRRRHPGAHPARLPPAAARRAPGPAGTAGPISSCAASSSRTRGSRMYRRRGQLIEPMFGHTKRGPPAPRRFRRPRTNRRAHRVAPHGTHSADLLRASRPLQPEPRRLTPAKRPAAAGKEPPISVRSTRQPHAIGAVSCRSARAPQLHESGSARTRAGSASRRARFRGPRPRRGPRRSPRRGPRPAAEDAPDASRPSSMPRLPTGTGVLSPDHPVTTTAS